MYISLRSAPSTVLTILPFRPPARHCLLLRGDGVRQILAAGGEGGDASEGGDVEDGSCRVLGIGVALSNGSATQWQEDVFCSFAFSSETKRQRHRGSRRGLNALVAVVRVGDGRGLFGEIEPVVAPFVNTQQC